MSQASNVIAMGIPVFNLLWWAGEKIAKRVRARRAGRAQERIDLAAVKEGIDRAADLARRDAVHDRLVKASDMLDMADPEKTPREKPPTHRGQR